MIVNHSSLSAADVRVVAAILVQHLGWIIVKEPDQQRCILRPHENHPIAFEINRSPDISARYGHIGLTFTSRAAAIKKFESMIEVVLNPDTIKLPRDAKKGKPDCFRFFISGGLHLEFGWGDYLIEAH